MAAIAKTKLGVGLLGIGVELHKATLDEGGIAMDSLCECEKRPKQSINCAGCGASYTSWLAVPKRGYPKDADAYTVVLSKADIEAARAGAKHEMLDVEKVTDLMALAKVCAFGDSYYVVPDPKAKDFELKAYALFLQVLASTSRVMLTRLTSRGVTTRYAIVPDAAKGVLLALKVLDLREVPFDVPAVKLDGGEAQAREAAQVRMVLDSQYSPEAAFPAEVDGLVVELERRLAALQKEPVDVAVKA